MKLLILLLAITLGIWLWKRGRNSNQTPAPRPTTPTKTSPHAVRPMVQCLYCQIHLPLEDTVQGILGTYCSETHRKAAGDRSPAA
jgi:uncharacterized protein